MGLGEEELTFPHSDVSGWDAAEVPPSQEAEAASEAAPEDLLFDREADFASPALLTMEDVPHPDEASYIPPPPPAGHGLRAKLALTAEAEEAGSESLVARALAWIRRLFS